MLWMINDTRKNDGRPVHNSRLGQACPHIGFVYFEQVQMLQFGYHHELAESSQLDLVLKYFCEKSEIWQVFWEKKCNPPNNLTEISNMAVFKAGTTFAFSKLSCWVSMLVFGGVFFFISHMIHVWYIYIFTYIYHKNQPKCIGKYTSPMDPMGTSNNSLWISHEILLSLDLRWRLEAEEDAQRFHQADPSIGGSEKLDRLAI